MLAHIYRHLQNIHQTSHLVDCERRASSSLTYNFYWILGNHVNFFRMYGRVFSTAPCSSWTHLTHVVWSVVDIQTTAIPVYYYYCVRGYCGCVCAHSTRESTSTHRCQRAQKRGQNGRKINGNICQSTYCSFCRAALQIDLVVDSLVYILIVQSILCLSARRTWKRICAPKKKKRKRNGMVTNGMNIKQSPTATHRCQYCYYRSCCQRWALNMIWKMLRRNTENNVSFLCQEFHVLCAWHRT